MATLANIRELRYDSVFKAHIEGALLKELITILTESAGATNHAARLAYAKSILGNTAMVVDEIAAVLAAHPTIQDTGAGTADATLATAVTQALNALAV